MVFPLFRSSLARRASIACIARQRTRHLHSTAVTLFPEIPFKLADIGEGIAEVEILQWFVKEGEPVKQFQNVCEVQSDKATVEITSRYDGIVTKVHYNVGEMAQVGHTLIDIEVDEVTAASHQTSAKPAQSRKPRPKSATSTEAPVAKRTVSPVEVTPEPTSVAEVSRPALNFTSKSSDEKVLTSPSVRRLAKEHNIDLMDIEGSGPQGRVLKEDLLEYIRLLAATPSPPPPAAAVPSNTTSTNASTSDIPSYLTSDQVVPLTGIQKMMVKSMNAALNIPHFGYADEIEMDALHNLREQLKPASQSRGVRLSYMPFMIKATSLALKYYPTLNASVSEDSTYMTYHAAHNISVAMDTPAGLLVPNIKNVEQKNILEIAEELNRLQQLASAGKLTVSDLSGGTFSISNIGSIGGTYMSPVVLVPQVAIGAVGKIQTLPRFAPDGSVVPVRLMRVSWSGDHRVIDGATMARFSNTWKAYLESPTKMLAEMK